MSDLAGQAAGLGMLALIALLLLRFLAQMRVLRDYAAPSRVLIALMAAAFGKELLCGIWAQFVHSLPSLSGYGLWDHSPLFRPALSPLAHDLFLLGGAAVLTFLHAALTRRYGRGCADGCLTLLMCFPGSLLFFLPSPVWPILALLCLLCAAAAIRRAERPVPRALRRLLDGQFFPISVFILCTADAAVCLVLMGGSI